MEKNLETNIKDIISSKMEEGIVEEIITKEFESSIRSATDQLFNRYGGITSIIEKKIKSVMVPYLENYDYSEYIVKLDAVLVDILKNSTVDNKEIIKNFKHLVDYERKSTINATDLFEEWMKYVAENVETHGLDVYFEDSPHYESVEVNYYVEYNEERSWSSHKSAVIIFECEHDEEMNFEVRIHRWDHNKKNEWTLDYEGIRDLTSLKRLNSFQILLMQLSQDYTSIILDLDSDSSEVEPDAEPEASFS
ncbi:hypothetical protein [Oceanobacillus profundus]|uniref:Uncharacterized protein n=1 Tax=Oceanobacillus profundus TaxID=372463 RepID=A0A417YGK1_9BACI|nr:hypothetical protein [Oceanobacillus profundus]RHW31894.1 hypothetical protein D1B32_11690 [Oceanobacillus profundus]